MIDKQYEMPIVLQVILAIVTLFALWILLSVLLSF
jgi:hypothetical protein